jgi:hypothetical protein
VPKYTDPKKAEQIMRAAGVIPLEPFKGSGVKWKCQCKKCKSIVYPAYNSVNSQKTNPCRKCAAFEMGARRRAKVEKQNVSIMKLAKLSPLLPYPGSHIPWKSKCLKCKKIVFPNFVSVKQGSGCIYCAGKKVDELDVRAYFKKAGYIPIGNYPGAKKKWKAKHKPCGKIVYPEYSKVKQGRGCAVCSGNAKVFEPEAKKLFLKNSLKPLVPFINSQEPWRSKCLVCGKTVSPNYAKVKARGHQCSYCSGNKVDSKDAIAIMKKARFKPLVVYPGANKPWKSQCLGCKRVTSPNFSAVKTGTGCKYCSGKAVVPKEAVALMKKRGFKTLEPYPGATNKWLVQCLYCKNKFQTYFYNTKDERGCRYCAGVEVDMKVVNLKMKELNLKPLVEFPGATTGWKSRCLVCQRIVTPDWSHIKNRESGCAYCSKKRVPKEEVIEMLKKAQIKPIGIFVNGKTPWQAKCLKCKKTIYIRINDMRAGQSGCIYCAGRKVDEIDAMKLAVKCGFVPLVKYPGANTPWKCKCKVCGKTSTPRYTTMQQRQGGCKFCSTGGFDFLSPAIIYLISSSKFSAHKVGVAGATEHNQRLDKHRLNGWTIYKHKEFKNGEVAFAIEQKVLNWFMNDKKLFPFVSPEDMPQGGSSETVDAAEIDLATIWAKVEELSRVKR